MVYLSQLAELRGDPSESQGSAAEVTLRPAPRQCGSANGEDGMPSVTQRIQFHQGPEMPRQYFDKLILDKSQSNLDKLQIIELCFGLAMLSWVSVINGP